MVDCKSGVCFPSIAGVAFRLGILKGFAPLECGRDGLFDTDSPKLRARTLEGAGECIGVSVLGGDRGDCTITLGGDLVFDLGGEKATIDEGRGFGVLHGACNVLTLGVTDPVPLRSER